MTKTELKNMARQTALQALAAEHDAYLNGDIGEDLNGEEAAVICMELAAIMNTIEGAE